MTSPRACQAKNPALCPYHGTTAALNTIHRRKNMMEASKIYREIQDRAEPDEKTWALYDKVREAQILYYATDEGYLDLEKAITAIDPSQRRFLMNLRDEAQAFRHEEEIKEGGSGWAEKPKTISPAGLRPFPLNMNLKEVDGAKTLSTVRNPDGSKTHFRWSTTNSQIYIETQEADGGWDMESARSIGKAKTRDEAYSIAYSWFRLNG